MLLNKISVLFMFLSVFSCGVRNPAGHKPEQTAINNWDSQLEQLKEEVLELACNEKMREDYQREINNQSRYLNPAQLERALKNMQEDISCG